MKYILVLLLMFGFVLSQEQIPTETHEIPLLEARPDTTIVELTPRELLEERVKQAYKNEEKRKKIYRNVAIAITVYTIIKVVKKLK